MLPLDYETLRLIWWLLLGVLLIGFAITDGFDMGTAALLPFVARNDTERRVVINTVGPVWEGNQVWFILGGGAIFAAWPPLYAVSFSGFYLAMFVVLCALILRPVAFKYRSKVEDASWRGFWDWALFVGGFVPALIFGVAVGNVLQGVPFQLDADLRPEYTGSFFGLLNPFALLCGLVSVAMLVMHGAAWLCMKTEGTVRDRARLWGTYAAAAVVVLFAVAGVLVATVIDGYVITSEVVTDGPSNPLTKTVASETGAWVANYSEHTWMLIAPVLGLLGAVVALAGMRIGASGMTFIGSKLSVVGVISTVGLSMFPFILPSSIQPEASLTAWDSSSSHLTLFIMLIATAIFLPIVLAYTAWAFKILWGKVTPASVRESAESY